MTSEKHEIARLVEEIRGSTMSEEQIRSRYPHVIAWFNEHVSLVDLMSDAGVKLAPISPDSTGVLVGLCPSCSGPMLVRST